MNSWQKALALALGLPSTILGIFFAFQQLVVMGYVSQGVAQGVLIAAVVLILIKMIQVSWKKKKIKLNKQFYLLSSINIIPAFILGGGLTLDSLALIGALLVLVLNHTILVKIVQSVTLSATAEGEDAQRSLGRILILMGLKVVLLMGLVASIYFYKKTLLTKLFLIIFFQLIIQVLSIKNNYQNS